MLRVWCERDGKILLHRAGTDARRLAGQHELPTAAQAGLDPARVARGPLLAKKRRSITRFQITESIHAAAAPRGQLRAELVWVALTDLGALTLSGPHRRWVGGLLARPRA